MNQEQRQKLAAQGRTDLIEIYDFTKEGYAGVLPNGQIVDRRKEPNAIACQKNRIMDTPTPRLTEDGVCPITGNACDRKAGEETPFGLENSDVRDKMYGVVNL